MSKIRVCVNCRFWKKPTKRFEPHGVCLNPKLYWQRNSEDSTGAYGLTDDFGNNEIHTGPQFGCVHFTKL